MTEQKKQVLPLFYKNPQAITVEAHGKLGLSVRKDYSFAKEANSIPLVASEYAAAAKHYPIVFIQDDVKTSLVITGFRDGENVFVNANGEWANDTYVPGYVNRYPFIFLEDEANDQLVLCLDVEADMVNTSAENPLFKDSSPTEFAEGALKTCAEYQSFLNATREFVAALIEQDLLIENQAELTAPDGKALRLKGFSVIDEKKFKELSDSTILDWHNKGWLYLAYAHFISMSNWTRIAHLTQTEPNVSSETVH
jgi:hypothetical protein